MAISSKLTSTNINISSGLILPIHTNDPGDGAVGEKNIIKMENGYS